MITLHPIASLMRERSAFLQFVRSYFASRDYLEVMTPVLMTTPGVETTLGCFETTWKDWGQKDVKPFFLRTSPEICMKLLLAAGETKLFELATCFRNHGEHGPHHNPEFLMLEFYQSPCVLQEIIDQSVDFIRRSWQMIRHDDGAFSWTVHQHKISDLFEELLGIKLMDQDPSLARAAKEKGVLSVNHSDDFNTAFSKIMIDKIEPWLNEKPLVVLTHYPASQPTLAVQSDGFSERFEIYLNGTELCNGYQELLEIKETRQRFKNSKLIRQDRGELVGDDAPFLDTMDHYMNNRILPSTCGNALGLDRLYMLAKGSKDIKNGLPFAHFWGLPD